MLALPIKVQLDGGCSRRIPPRLQILNRAGFMTLKKSRTNRLDHGALARFVGANKQVDARTKVPDFQRPTELAQLFNSYATKLHAPASGNERSRSSQASNIGSASCRERGCQKV